MASPQSAFQTIKGTNDRLPKDAPRWRQIEAAARKVLEHAGAGEIHTPIFEEAGVFMKGVGESSDIVRKEMYRFSDRGERDLCLRPEATAPIIRAYLQHGMKVWPTPVKLWTIEPMFRAEKPQKGRERQFFQIGLEIIGLEDALADAECIDLGLTMLKELGLRDFTLHLGNVGDPEDRRHYNHYLRQTLEPWLIRLSEDSKERFELNPMRILDSKDRNDQELLKEIKIKPMLDFLGPAAKAHFEAVQSYLKAWNVDFVVDPTIVRGLDYYRRTAFEVIHHQLGAQSTILAGGRYDGLAEIFGGPFTPGVGWGSGVERLILALEAEGIAMPEEEKPLVYLIALDEESLASIGQVAKELRSEFKASFNYKIKALGKSLADAEKYGAKFAVIIGEDERKNDLVTIKNLATREQETLKKDDLTKFLLDKR